MKTPRTSAVVLLAIIVIGLPLKLKSDQAVTAQPAIGETGSAPGDSRLTEVDLKPFYDDTFQSPSCWHAIPRGQATFADIPFQVGGLLHLWGEGPAGIHRVYPERVDGIPASGTFQMLYVLHATTFAAEEGTPIAEVVFRYADGSSATNAIHYGTDSRDFWKPLGERHPFPTNSLSKVVWRGDYPDLPDWVDCLRLFAMGISNPKPASEVKSVDLISTKSNVSWIVLALTTGPEGMLKVDPKLQQNEPIHFEEVSIAVSAKDKASGDPIADARFAVTLTGLRHPRNYGSFEADKAGEAVIDLPPERIKLLSIRAESASHAPVEMSWNLSRGEKVPANYTFKLTKGAKSGAGERR